MEQKTMQAAWHEKQGAARDVIQYGEMPVPEPSSGEVRIRVYASGVNPSDTKTRSGWGGITMHFPRMIPHQDGAGVIESVGEGVPSSRIDERVWIYEAQLGRPFGTAAEFVVVAKRFPLSEVAAAHEVQDSGEMIDKAVIEIA
jgi:NADPH2:quinone reductase